ncbi:MAG: type III pantothenate kinase [Dehalococcoidia bacterium]|nr:type III pantothenate kinase [Dehalococcoidia bacterium]MDW8120370.1 type III pantothenate kinase [Chloroflexota bacterium]
MLLALDIGNSNVKIGAFRGEELVATWRVATDPRRMPDDYGVLLLSLLNLRGLHPSHIRDAALCSVVPPLTWVFEEMCRTFFQVKPLIVGAGVKTGMRILYDTPRDVGADRVAASAAAYRLYGGPVIVVEVGTFTVLDAVTRDGDYLGGAIHPGPQVVAEAVFTSASQLRRVELVRPKSAIGRNTVAAIQSGVLLGHIGMVEGLVKRFKEELGDDAKVIGTGGLVSLIARETDIFTAVNPDLILHGLRIIYEMNRPER